MKKPLFSMFQNSMAVLLSAALLFSCSQIETFDNQDFSVAQERIPVNLRTGNSNARVQVGYDACGTFITTDLIAGQNIRVGEVSIFNDEEYLYFSISIPTNKEGFDDGDWFIQKVHAFAGQVETDFVTKGKKGIINPSPGKFPINEAINLDLSIVDQIYTFPLIKLDDLKNEDGELTINSFDVAIHAELVRIENIVSDGEGNLSGTPIQFESAWAKGERFNPEGLGNWSMFVEAVKIQNCEIDCDPIFLRPVDIDGNGAEDYSVEYQVSENGIPVGSVKVNRTGNSTSGTVTVTFTILEEFENDFDYNKIGVKINPSQNDGASVFTECSNIGGNIKILCEPAGPGGSLKWEVIFTEQPQKLNLLLFADLKGVCD